MLNSYPDPQFPSEVFQTVTVQATDPGSGPDTLSVTLTQQNVPNGRSFVAAGTFTGDPGTTRVGRVTFDYSNVPESFWTVSSVTLTDRVGNSRTLSAEELEASQNAPSFEVLSQQPLVSEPLSVTATAGVESAFVTWDPPEFLGPGGIQKYVIGLGRYGPSIDVPGDVTSATIPGLLPGYPYQFSVSANYFESPSALSNTVVPLEGGGVRPTGVKVQRDDGDAIVSWRRPPTGSGPRIVGYVVTGWLNGINRKEVRFDTTTTRQRISGLFREEEYVFTVRAVFSNGTIGALSTPTAPVLVTVFPGEPTRVVGKPGTAAGTATVTWRRPDYTGTGPLTSYRITVANNSGFYRLVVVGTSETWARLTGLPSGPLFLQVSASNANGFGNTGFGIPSPSADPFEGRP